MVRSRESARIQRPSIYWKAQKSVGWLAGRQLRVAVLNEVVQPIADGARRYEPGVEELRRQRREIDQSKDLVHHEEVGRRAHADDAWLMTHAPEGLWPPEVGL